MACALLVFSVAACSNKPAPDKPAPDAAAAKPAAASAQTANGPDGPVKVVSGTVQETMNASTYTYVRVRTADGDIWAATQQFPVAVGDRVRVPLQMAMKDFQSKTLNRTFPEIYFVTEIEREGQPSSGAAGAPPMMSAHSSGQPGAAPPAQGTPDSPQVVVERMPPPEGGISIGEVWAKQAALAGKTVTVRGKVVKFNGGILDRNWMHIQDGTGSAKEGTHDLTVTSQGVAKVGDVVTATGKLGVNRDFGAGYAYKVILEGATITAK
ncbi:MAG: hypothetical protein ACM3NQ_01705 [Bacteroidales bacterium]